MTVVDIGGGTGRVSQSLAGTNLVVVCDSSWGMVGESRRKGLNACLAEAEHLPFPDGAFERALVVDALHHMGDQGRALAEALRVLAPGGRLVLEEPDLRLFAVRLIALAERLLGMRSRMLGERDLLALLRRPGLTVGVPERGGGAMRASVEKQARC